MPIEEQETHIQGYPYTVLLATTTNLTISVYIYDDGQQAPGYMDMMIQSLVDHMQSWDQRMSGADVQGQKYDTLMWAVHPTVSDPPAGQPAEEGTGGS